MAGLKVAPGNIFYDFSIKINTDVNNAVLLVSAFFSCLGMTFIILACVVPKEKLFWPFFMLLFYALAGIPIFIAKRRNADTTGTNPCSEFALFLTAGIVFSSFALPVVLARASVITWLASSFTILGNVIIYLTILMYCIKESDADAAYGGMF